MKNICRLCAEDQDNCVGIFENDGAARKLERKIINFLHIQIMPSDSLPTNVCLNCCDQLDKCCAFAEQALRSQEILGARIKGYKYEPPELAEADNSDCEFHSDNENSVTNENDFGKNSDFAEEKFSYTADDVSETCESRSNWIEDNEEFILNEEKDNSIRQTEKNGDNRKLLNIENAKQCYKEFKYEEVNSVTVERNDSNTIETVSKWLCYLCSEEFKDHYSLLNHVPIVHQMVPKFKCEVCSKVFEKLDRFRAHCRKHARHKTSPLYECADCKKMFYDRYNLQEHCFTHMNIRKFVCEECGGMFKSRQGLKIHRERHLPDAEKPKYLCTECSKSFSSKGNLNMHSKIHRGLRDRTCHECGKSFLQKSQLDCHLLSHTNNCTVFCSICNKGFKATSQLRRHESVHSNDKPYMCSDCGQRFRTNKYLRAHRTLHSDVRPYICEYCHKGFRFKNKLDIHRRQHTGERPYSCLECEHHFATSYRYNVHMRKWHLKRSVESTQSINQFPPISKPQPIS